MTSDSGNGAPSPRSFAIQHQRPRESFTGCSRITDYELLGKLGEGTFGYVSHYVADSPAHFAFSPLMSSSANGLFL